MNDYKYLVIFEDQTLHKTNELAYTDYSSAEDGNLEIVRLGDLKQYLGGDPDTEDAWGDIVVWGASKEEEE